MVLFFAFGPITDYRTFHEEYMKSRDCSII